MVTDQFFFYELLRETLDNIKGLQEEHRGQLQEEPINNEQISKETLLSNIVKPVIIRLNEGKHSKEVVDSPQSGSGSSKGKQLISFSIQIFYMYYVIAVHYVYFFIIIMVK